MAPLMVTLRTVKAESMEDREAVAQAERLYQEADRERWRESGIQW